MKLTRAPVKDEKRVFGLFHHVLSGPSCAFFMVPNDRRRAGVFSSGTDRWEMVEKWTIQANILRCSSAKKQYVSTTHIPMHFELNHTSPCAAFMAANRVSEYLLGLFSHSITPAILCVTRTLLLSPFVTIVIDRPLHDPLRQPLNRKTLQKQSPPFLLLPFPAH